MANRNRKYKEISPLGFLLSMVAIVAVVVVLSTLLWNQLESMDLRGNRSELVQNLGGQTGGNAGSNTPGNSKPGNTEPQGFSIPEDATGEEAIALYAQHKGISVDDYKMGYPYYPERLYEAYEKSPEARQFILDAPFKYDKTFEKDMSEFENVEGVPLFLQWDERWGYTDYAYGLGGLTACAPTCLSMVDYYYTRNPEHTPDWMMNFSTENGYVNKTLDENGNHQGGTNWTLFSQGAVKLGYLVKEVPLHKGTLVRYLKAGTPVICHVSECVFTYSGHFIVLVGYDEENDRILVNDPNSVSLSQRGCTYEEIETAIRNMWAFTPDQQQ